MGLHSPACAAIVFYRARSGRSAVRPRMADSSKSKTAEIVQTWEKTGMSTTTHIPPPQRCETCARSRPADDKDGIMRRAGWLNCDLLPEWGYRSPHWGCDFSPSRWIKKSGGWP